MPKHILFLLKHAAIGALAALVFVGLLFWLNVANLWHLVTQTSGGWIAAAVMCVLFVVTFASVQMGRAIMGLGVDEGSAGGGSGTPITKHEAIAIPVTTQRR